jgi:hypothetical protein
LQSELSDDPVDRTFTDAEVALPEFLRDDFGAGFRIQEAVTDHLADEFLGASVIGFGAAFGTEEGRAAFLQKKGAELEVTLTAIAEFGGSMVNAFRSAFALDEHGEFAGDFIGFSNGQGAGWTLDAFLEELERNHADLRGRVCQNKSIKIWHTQSRKSRAGGNTSAGFWADTGVKPKKQGGRSDELCHL